MSHDRTLEVLEEVAEYLERPRPNAAMSLLQRVEERIEAHKRASKADRFSRDLCQALNEGNGSYKP